MVSIMWDLVVYAENMRKESVGGRVTVTRIAGGGEKKAVAISQWTISRNIEENTGRRV